MTYTNLQEGIDTIVGTLGTPKTIKLLNRISNNLNLTKKSDLQQVELLATFIISESYRAFNLTPYQIGAKDKQYNKARTASYHLLRKYTPLSYRNIGCRFEQTKRNAIYYFHKCHDLLSLPKQYPDFTKKYTLLEERILDFMTQIH